MPHEFWGFSLHLVGMDAVSCLVCALGPLVSDFSLQLLFTLLKMSSTLWPHCPIIALAWQNPTLSQSGAQAHWVCTCAHGKKYHHGVLESSNLSIMNSILDSYNDRPVSFCGCWQARIRRRGDLSSGGHTPGRPTLTSPHRTHFSHPPTFFPSTPCLPRLSPAQRLASTTLNECFFQQWDFSSWLTWWKLYELTLWEKRTKWSQCVCVSVCVCMWMFVGAEVAAATKSCWKLYYKLRDIRSNKSLMCLPQGSRKQVWLSGRIGHTHNSSANGQGPCSP